MDINSLVCVNQEPFNIFTSGLYYMCIEQRNGLNLSKKKQKVFVIKS